MALSQVNRAEAGALYREAILPFVNHSSTGRGAARMSFFDAAMEYWR